MSDRERERDLLFQGHMGGPASQLFTLLDCVSRGKGVTLEVALRDNNIDLDTLVETIPVEEAANVIAQVWTLTL